jgi:YD repeat-containing protein
MLIEPGNVTTEWSYQRTGEATLPLAMRQTAEGGETTTAHHDILGRIARSERSALGGDLVQNLFYDTRGNLVVAERPHRASVQDSEAFAFTYDNLHRVLSTAHPDGGTTRRCPRVLALHTGRLGWASGAFDRSWDCPRFVR